jgi:predicted DNA-binding transcriptional regulator AlpA
MASRRIRKVDEHLAPQRDSAGLDRTRTVAERHGVSVRTIERWIEAGLLPPPLRIRGRKYWPAGTVAKTDSP